MHVTGEEHGLYGSSYYSENPLFPITNTVADVNIDMVGRRDDLHKDSNNYIYLIIPMLSVYISGTFYPVNNNTGKEIWFRPPSYVFGIVWPILLILIGLFCNLFFVRKF